MPHLYLQTGKLLADHAKGLPVKDSIFFEEFGGYWALLQKKGVLKLEPLSLPQQSLQIVGLIGLTLINSLPNFLGKELDESWNYAQDSLIHPTGHFGE